MTHPPDTNARTPGAFRVDARDLGVRQGQAAADTLRASLARVLASGRRSVDRLSYAACSVAFCVDGAAPVSLRLDRRPAELAATETPDTEIFLTAAEAVRFADGALPLSQEIMAGRVTHRGPVRPVLAVEPILRAGLAACADAGSRDGDWRPGRIDAAIDSDLLAIQTQGLRKSFGANVVLQDLDLEVPEGAISVVLGPSGTGKSVLLQHVIGALAPDAGGVLVRGRALSTMNRLELMQLRRGIGVMFQDGALFSGMNVYDNVAFPLRQHTDFSDAEVRDAVEEHLVSVGLSDVGRRMPNELSGGMRKRAGLARALVLNPGIVLCDEPDSGLDPVRTSLLGDLLVEQHAEYGGTVVVVTHNVLLARRIADHISVLWQGRVLESGLAHQVLESETPFVRQFLAGAAAGPLGMGG
jgi:phospholipid/cholesterol/gamma-HCH transport system ATP-binding protein